MGNLVSLVGTADGPTVILASRETHSVFVGFPAGNVLGLLSAGSTESLHLYIYLVVRILPSIVRAKPSLTCAPSP